MINYILFCGFIYIYVSKPLPNGPSFIHVKMTVSVLGAPAGWPAQLHCAHNTRLSGSFAEKESGLVHTPTHKTTHTLSIHVMVQTRHGDDENSWRFITVNWAPFTAENLLHPYILFSSTTTTPQKQPHHLMACTGARAHVIQHSDTDPPPHKSPDPGGLEPRIRHVYIIILYLIGRQLVVKIEIFCVFNCDVVTLSWWFYHIYYSHKYFILSGYILSIYIYIYTKS